MKINLTGQRFGKLTVQSRAGANKHRKVIWNCRCDCGGSARVTTGDLRRSDARATRSCGCEQRQRTGDANRKHGLSDSRAYSIWRTMHRRCEDPSCAGWEHYGKRGIKVCKRWSSLDMFIADMGHPPDGLTLDRIDPAGNYEPSNCRWATYKEQARGSIRYVTFRDETLSLSEWAARIGIQPQSLLRRLAKHPVEFALTAPPWAKPSGGSVQ